MKLETHTQHPHIDEQSWVHETGGNLKKNMPLYCLEQKIIRLYGFNLRSVMELFSQ